MAAGLYCITTNYGALFETGAEYPAYIPYQKNFSTLAANFAAAIDGIAPNLNSRKIQKHLYSQINYVNDYYNWNKQGGSWSRFIEGALNARSK